MIHFVNFVLADATDYGRLIGPSQAQERLKKLGHYPPTQGHEEQTDMAVKLVDQARLRGSSVKLAGVSTFPLDGSFQPATSP